MGVTVFLLVTVVLGGYALPLPCLVFSWREWSRTRTVKAPAPWRRVVSTTAVLLATPAILLWIYAVIRQLRDEYSYIYTSAQIGRWSSLALLLLSCFAEGKCRTYLLLACTGLFFFYGVSIGELP
jgi:hypothetical protein